MLFKILNINSNINNYGREKEQWTKDIENGWFGARGNRLQIRRKRNEPEKGREGEETRLQEARLKRQK